uniref:Uncharacterized protein n=1 Tax=Acrobeloides nanus TaxID=290746 RepID=A0A914ELC4_9BILA
MGLLIYYYYIYCYSGANNTESSKNAILDIRYAYVTNKEDLQEIINTGKTIFILHAGSIFSKNNHYQQNAYFSNTFKYFIQLSDFYPNFSYYLDLTLTENTNPKISLYYEKHLWVSVGSEEQNYDHKITEGVNKVFSILLTKLDGVLSKS